MSDAVVFNYGPLAGLIGEWQGNKGKDIAPEPDGTEVNEYFETIIFTEALDLANAEEQRVSALHYTLKVQRISNKKVIHQETGYWMWDQNSGEIMNSLTIPRGLALVAGGHVTGTDKLVFDVKAAIDDPKWKLVQSPFLSQKALTKSISKQFVLEGDTLSYTQSILLDIYGREFEHTDQNRLQRVK